MDDYINYSDYYIDVAEDKNGTGEGNFLQRNMWDRKEDALNRRLEALAAREDWEGVLRELDRVRRQQRTAAPGAPG